MRKKQLLCSRHYIRVHRHFLVNFYNIIIKLGAIYSLLPIRKQRKHKQLPMVIFMDSLYMDINVFTSIAQVPTPCKVVFPSTRDKVVDKVD